MSTTEEPKINEETGLPEGLDPGQSWATHTPEERSEPLPVSFRSRLVGKNQEEVAEILEKEQKEKDAALKAEEAASAPKTSTSSSKS